MIEFKELIASCSPGNNAFTKLSSACTFHSPSCLTNCIVVVTVFVPIPSFFNCYFNLLFCSSCVKDSPLKAILKASCV